MTAEQFRLKFIVSKDGQTQMREKWLECVLDTVQR